MKIIPAIDILDGKVVRLYKGSFQEKKEYGNDPVSMAKFWQDEGAEYLHIVDLNGAEKGEPKNLQVIKKIIENITIPVEVGGGIRTLNNIKTYMELGVEKIVLGTAVICDLSFLDQDEIKSNTDKIVISCDSKTAIDFNRVDRDASYVPITTGTSAWIQECEIHSNELFSKMVSARIRYLNYTVRSKDGTLEGLFDSDILSLNSFLSQIGNRDIQVTYAGGIASLEDIKKLALLKNNKLEGVIIGKALYENKFTLKEAQNIANVS